MDIQGHTLSVISRSGLAEPTCRAECRPEATRLCATIRAAEGAGREFSRPA
jgi:hypothetical protein